MAHGTLIEFDSTPTRSAFRSSYRTNFHKVAVHGDGFIDVLTTIEHEVVAPVGWTYEYEIIVDQYGSGDPAFEYVDAFFVEEYLVPTAGIGGNIRPTWVIFGVIPRGLARLGDPLPDAQYVEPAQ